jgi:hypothetical protein
MDLTAPIEITGLAWPVHRPNRANEAMRSMNRRPHPVFDRLTGKLRFRDTLVRERTRKPAPLVEMLLLRFDEAGWPEALEAPLPEGVFDPRQQLIEAVRRLNKGLRGKLMCFHVRGSVITWEDRAADVENGRTRRHRGAKKPN